jgi:hypothetical protein
VAGDVAGDAIDDACGLCCRTSRFILSLFFVFDADVEVAGDAAGDVERAGDAEEEEGNDS